MSEFKGFPKEGLQFLKGLVKNNKKEWFDKNRGDYDDGLIGPAKSFVVAMGEKLQTFSPDIVADPNINGSIRRINRDVRFSKDKSPYKTHLDIQFWEGGDKRCSGPSFLFRMYHDKLVLGVGMYEFGKKNLGAYRDAVVDPKAGAVLVKAIQKARKHGYDIGGEHYKKVPRGYDPEHPNADLLRYNALYAGHSRPMPTEVHSQKFLTYCFREYKKLRPLHEWLVMETIV